MPKVTLTERQRKQELLRRYINARLALTGIETYKKLAPMLPMPLPTFMSKMKGKSEFKQSELSAICRVLRFSDEEKLDIL